MRIEQLGPPDAHHSTGLVLHWRDQLLFALLPIYQWQRTGESTLAHFVGIGGHLEAGERWAEAVCREAQEEAGVQVTLCSPQETWLLDDRGTVLDITASLEWPEPPLPLLIWSAVFRIGAPPHEQRAHFVNAVFEAILPDDVEPHPAAEMPAIMALSRAQLHRAAAQPICLGDLIADGARIWASEPIPDTVWVAPQGSALWYEVWLRACNADR